MTMPKLPDAEPLDEENLARALVGGPFEFDGRVLIEDYDPAWPALYEREVERIRVVLGAAALSLEHVGSTSVPGLAAKPIIDIDLLVADTTDEDAYVPALEAGGYVLRLREPEWYEHRMFKGPDTDVNLHVFSPGAEEPERHKVLRDWLRSHPQDRDLYARTKRELAERDWEFMYQYTDAKGQVLREILTRAGCR
ncbi:MAG TPA: GrpB family protein [Actinocrinis sp.]|nr:GrpB family protein [Actinocrinis sp.]